MSELQEIFAGVKLNQNEYVEVTDDNKICFQLQEGPITEHGVNGCQIDTMIYACKVIVQKFNDRFPCRENSLVITKLDEAMLWLMARTEERIQRNAEGKNQA